MKTLNLQLEPSSDPAYLRIASAVISAIQAGRLSAGDTLPSTRHLAQSLDLHRQTVMAGLAELVAQGWLIAHPRKAYRVNTTLPRHAQPDPQVTAVAHSQSRVVPAFTQTEFDTDPEPEQFRYAFRAESPDLDAFPKAEFRRHVSRGLRSRANQILDYGPPEGIPELVGALSQYVKRLRSISDKQLIVTSGAQEAIYLTARLLLDADATVAVEPLGYPPAWQAFRAAGAKLVPLQMDQLGLIPESFAQAARQHRIKLLYLMPLHQFPTTRTLPIERRMEIYDIASNHNIAILEDDYDHEFHYTSKPLLPMASNDPQQLVFYAFSLSKIAFPAMRIGALVVPKALANNVLAIRQLTLGNPGKIIQSATAEWMISGGFDRHLWKMNRLYKERRDVLVKALSNLQEQGKNIEFQIPAGGMAIWTNMHTDTESLANMAAVKSVLVQRGGNYQLDRKPSNHLRLGFANQSAQKIVEGIEILGSLI